MRKAIPGHRTDREAAKASRERIRVDQVSSASSVSKTLSSAESVCLLIERAERRLDPRKLQFSPCLR